MDGCSDSHKSSRQSQSDSHVHSYSRERYRAHKGSERSRHSSHKSSRDRSRSRDGRRDRYRRRSSSRSRSNSPYRTVRENGSRRCESSRVCDTKTVPAELKLITHDACYFLLKSNNFDNLLLAKAESVWSTPPQNELRINNAFRVCEFSAVFIIQCTDRHFVAISYLQWSTIQDSNLLLVVLLPFL